MDTTKNQTKITNRDEYINQKSISPYITEFISDINNNKNIKGISTGFKKLDNILDGGLYTGLYFIGAVSSLGKSTFILQMADAIAQNGYDVIFFSIEMTKKELLSKSLSRISYILDNKNGLNTRQILNCCFTKEEKKLIENSLDEYKKYSDNVYIFDGLDDIGTKKIHLTVKDHINLTGRKPVVIIDYLQILMPYEMKASDKQNADKNVFELKKLSRANDIPVLAISSLNRGSYADSINMSSFKETGAIEYSSDVLLGLQFEGITEARKNESENFIHDSKNKDTRHIELRILKNRNGKTGDTIKFESLPKHNIFIEKDIAKKDNKNMPMATGKAR